MTTDADTLSDVVRPHPSPVVYPDSDGKPMSDNTLQWDTIAYVVQALRGWFLARLDVFVAGDLLWYYEEGNPKARVAPDGLIAFGRPPGYRGSYMQWVEGGVCPQVVFEVLSPKNTAAEMQRNFALCARLGCLEYYLIDPYEKALVGFERTDDGLTFISDAVGRHSPMLGLVLSFDDAMFRFVDPQGDVLISGIEGIEQVAEARAKEAEAGAKVAALSARLRALGVDPADVIAAE